MTRIDSLLLFVIVQLVLIYVTISDHVISLLPPAGSDEASADIVITRI